ncbi:MAG: DegT/DnrJ/EryC1/StrS family aminotransferase [Candidatus Bathyarchaeia archaeon]|jgi:perosamine synthetase
MTQKRRISVFSPHIPQSVVDAAAASLKSKLVNVGPQTSLFEDAFAAKFNINFAVALNSCTSALRLSCALADVGPGDEVITPAFTMIATNTAILEQYAKPVFADVDYDTANIDPADIEHRITEKTKAIICVHNLGYPCDLKELREIADAHDLALIEDCAHAIGATYHVKHIGSGSAFACFSFAAVKHITTGDGGMLATDSERIFEAANRRSWFGVDRSKRDSLTKAFTCDVAEAGFKMRMNGFLAAMGREQLSYLDGILCERRRKAKIYGEELANVKGVTPMQYGENRESSYFLYPIHVKRRRKFAEALNRKGIEVNVQNYRNDRFSVFGGPRDDLPNTAKIDRDSICLPIHEDLTENDQQYIIEAVKEGW